LRPLLITSLLASLLGLTSAARAEDASSETTSTEPTEGARGALNLDDVKEKATLFWVYGGVDITWWGLEWGDQSEDNRGILGGYARETDPYVMKNLEAGLKIAGFEIGLGYLTDKLGKFLNFSDSDELDSTEDPVSRTLRGYISYLPPIPSLRFQTNLTLRRFESRATVLGRRSLSGPPLAQTYVPYEGDAQVLNAGQTVKWFSTTRDVGLRAVVDVMELLEDDSHMMSAYLGYRRVDLVTPTDVTFDGSGGLTSALVGARSICSGVELGLQSDAPREEGLSFFYDVPVYWGSFSLESQYFDATGGYCFGFGAEAGLRYQSGPFGLDFGGKYLKLGSASTPGGDAITFKKAFPTVGILGDSMTVPEGFQSAISVARFESFSTLYVRAALAF